MCPHVTWLAQACSSLRVGAPVWPARVPQAAEHRRFRAPPPPAGQAAPGAPTQISYPFQGHHSGPEQEPLVPYRPATTGVSTAW